MTPRPSRPLALKIAAYLLGYPGDARFQAAWDGRRCAARAAWPAAAATMDRLAALSFDGLAALYVETFDLAPKRTLYLTAHELGESRERGKALLALGELYRQEGYLFPEGEIPDHIPALLELAALSPKARQDLAPRLAAAIDAIRGGVEDENPYGAVLDAALWAVGSSPRPLRAGHPAPDLEGLPYPIVSE